MMEIVSGVLLLAGSLFILLSAIGVLRMPDLFTRMSATTKAELLELCVEQGIPEDKAKGENMAGMRKLLLTKLNGIAQE